MIAHYYQTKTPISFWCRRGLNPRSLIQPPKTLPVELTRTHKMTFFFSDNFNSETNGKPKNLFGQDERGSKEIDEIK